MAYRLEKINELIKRELSKILLEEGESEPGTLVTILEAQTTLDLREAAVFFSVLPTAKSERVFNNLSARIFFIQQLLNKKLRMRPVPRIRFVLNTTESESQKIDGLLEKIKQTR